MIDVANTTPLTPAIADLPRTTKGISRFARGLINIAGRFFPVGTGARLRTALYKALGMKVGHGTLFDGPITVSCETGAQAYIQVGSHCYFNSPLHLDATAAICVGNGVSIGHHVVIVTAGHEIGPPESRAGAHRPAPVVIEDGAWIAANVTLLPGVRVGAGAVVAAGAVITEDVPSNTLVGGIPAQIIRALPK